MYKFFSLLFLLFLSFSSAFSQSYYSRYDIRRSDSIPYRGETTGEANDVQTYLLNQFFYGSHIESWVENDSIFQKIITRYEQNKQPIAGKAYVDSFGQRGASGMVLDKPGMTGTITLRFDTTILSQALLYDLKNHKKVSYYTNTDTGVACQNLAFLRLVPSKEKQKINGYDCVLWTPTKKSIEYGMVKVWICKQLPAAVQFVDLGQTFPGGVVRIEFPQNGFYYQLTAYKPIEQVPQKLKKQLQCTRTLKNEDNFIKGAIYDKKGLNLNSNQNPRFKH